MGCATVIGFAFAFAFALIVPAHAAPPVIEPYEFSGSGVFYEGCPGGYDILVEFSGRTRPRSPPCH
jgi:hypothetical protein